jgi:hypothetical protein
MAKQADDMFTEFSGWRSSAWSCGRCGTVVTDRTLHRQHHALLLPRLPRKLTEMLYETVVAITEEAVK